MKDLNTILKNERGVALMMVMTAMILLMAIYGEFTFESKISRIKATNIMDRSQAKLLAESGLQMAMTRLKLYKEAYNKLEANQAAKKQVPPQLLNQLWEIPFIFPIPVGANANRSFKDTVEKFTKETLLEGSMRVNVQNISNRMNLNLLRIDMAARAAATDMTDANGDHVPDSAEDVNTDGPLDMSTTAINNNVSVDQSLYFLMRRLVEDKREKDPSFEDRHANINYQQLVSNLKFYISDYGGMANDPYGHEAESVFSRIPLAPKYGPLSSASELYSIPGWDDELIELIKNEFSVYPSVKIDLNKLTENMLRILIPNIQDEQVREFFLYRDDPVNPKFFNTLEDFKNWVTNVERIMDTTTFDSRMAMFQKAKVTFGSNPNLFKVVSEGIYNRSTYTLVAYVYLPANQPAPQPGTNQGNTTNTTNNGPSTTGGNNTNTQNQSTQLFDPRIIELQVN